MEGNRVSFKKGDKFILELGEERKMFNEFQIAGTDLYVKKYLLEKLTPYKPGNLNIEHKSDDEQDLISRQAAIDTFYEMASDIDHLCTVGDYVHVLEGLSSAQPEMDCQKCIFCGFAGFKQFQTAQSKTEERPTETDSTERRTDE